VLTLALVFLALAAIITLFDGALVTLGRYESEKILKNTKIKAYLKLLRFFKYKTSYEGFRFLLKSAKYTFRLLFALVFFLYFFQNKLTTTLQLIPLTKAVGLILIFSYFIDFLSALIYFKKPKATLKALEIPVGLLLIAFVPVSAFGFFIMASAHPEIFQPHALNTKQVVQKLKQTLEESGLMDYLDTSDRKLMLSLASFKDKIAREIMMPRIKVFSLDIKSTVQTAVDAILKEGYSRVPVYEGNVDNIVGILLLKDLLSFYASTESDTDPRLQTSVEFLVKPATFTPETKKISHLLQEFRSKQTHLAIVVDEWGGTVSIEDILEELVGEIADEYDTDEETFYAPLASGGWIVDARMAIKDIESELGISIPLSPEYDTLGGYIFHKAGEIPKVGYKIHHAAFDLEVLSSSERSVDKIKISK
jgi:CBS domain containing-hemolysin-like protein